MGEGDTNVKMLIKYRIKCTKNNQKNISQRLFILTAQDIIKIMIKTSPPYFF